LAIGGTEQLTMHTIQKTILFLLLFGVSALSSAQENWTVGACIEYALNNNLKLNDLDYNIDSNKESHYQSYRELLPSLSADSDYGIQHGRSVDPNTNQIVTSEFFSNGYSINASLDLFRGFQKLNTISATKFLMKAAKEQLSQERYLLAFRVMTAFYDVQFSEGLLQISKEQEDISLTNYNLVNRQVELGVKAGSDLYEAEAILIGDRLLVTQNGNNVQAAKLILMQEMNLESSDEMQIILSEDLLRHEGTFQEIDSDSIYKEALAFIPIIKSQEFLVKAAKKDVALARGALYPTLKLVAGYDTGFFETNIDESGMVIPFKNQINDNLSRYLGVALTIPLSQRWSNRSAVKQQKINLLRADNNLNIQKQELNKVIQELVLAYSTAQTEYEQTQQSEASRLLSFEINQKRYNNGLISAMELFQAKNFYVNAQNENLRVLAKLKVQKKTIEFYKGLPVFNINNTK
jgi:outer membrane protein